MTSPLALQKISPKKRTDAASYERLRDEVRQTLLEGQRKIEEQKVLTYWKTGRLINQYIERHKTPYLKKGEHVVTKLASDLDIGDKVLYQCLRFVEVFPHFYARRNVTWSHYRALISVSDERKRDSLARTIDREDWSTRELEAWLKKIRSKNPKKVSYDPYRPLIPKLGKLHTYRLIAASKIKWPEEGILLRDHGFKGYSRLKAKNADDFKAGEIIEIAEGQVQKSERTEKDLYTYKAYLDLLIDADTLWVVLDLDQGEIGRQKLRLRGIDAPEINTPEGRRAYRFLKAFLAKAPYLIVRSYKNDKYDRYETDLFVPNKSSRAKPAETLGLPDLVFVNNLLLEKRLAVRMD